MLQPLLMLEGLILPDRFIYLRALDLYAQYPVDYEDALSIAHMERRGIREIVSYDRDFDRITEVTRVEP
jgi:predicted nucleic acid-binding protein